MVCKPAYFQYIFCCSEWQHVERFLGVSILGVRKFAQFAKKKVRVSRGLLYKLTISVTNNGRFLSEIILTPKT